MSDRYMQDEGEGKKQLLVTRFPKLFLLTTACKVGKCPAGVNTHVLQIMLYIKTAYMSFEWDKRFTSQQPGFQAHMG